jgi:hypothetical protein
VSLATEGFTKLGTIKIPALGGATSTDTPLVIKSADLTAAMLSSLKADWGDLRLHDGTNQLPIEIASTGIAWVKVVDVTVDNLVEVWGNKPAAVKEIDTATFGSRAVWSNSKLRAHMGATVYDSSGNNTLNFDNSGEDLAGQIGSASDYDGNTQYGRFNDSNANSNLGGKGKSSVWFKPDSGLSGKAIICFDRNNTSSYKHLLYVSGGSESVNAFIRLTNGSTYSAGFNTGGTITGWHRLTATFDRSLATERLKVYYDGVLIDTNDAENLDVSDNNDGVSLARWGNNRSYSGKIDEYDLSTDVSADKESIEYQNQAATGAWWIASDAGDEATTVIKIVNITASFLQSVESTSNIEFSLNQSVTSQKDIETAMLQKVTADSNITTSLRTRTAKILNVTTGFRARITKNLNITTGFKSLTSKVLNIISSFKSRTAKASNITTSFKSRASKTVNITTGFKSRIAKVVNITFDLLEAGVAATVSRTINITTSLLQRVDTAFNISSSLKQRLTKTVNISTALNVRVNGQLLIQTAFKETASAFKNITTSFLQQTTEIKNITFALDGVQPLLAHGATFRLSVIETTFRLSVIEPSYKFTIKG